ncbi:EamA family transporter, partial [Vibrio parahaemolyticus]|nr:EamA family transporter [Vibrio parahaemolyticus]
AMFMNLMPVVSVILASTLIGEKIYTYHIIGGLLVISGVILSQIKVRQRKPLSNSEIASTAN